MAADGKLKGILLAPAPRLVADIFDEDDLRRLRALGELTIHEAGPASGEAFDRIANDTELIIGQVDLPESRVKKASRLRAIFNVEGNFLLNIILNES
jgi:hypothetical protein